MKTYPSIPHYNKLPMKAYRDMECELLWGFGKQDGSNIRVEWTPKGGFSKWGRRNGLLDHSNPVLLEAPGCFQERYPDMDERLRELTRGIRAQDNKVTIFMEFFGPNSRFGLHEDEDHTVQIFDVDLYKKGLIPPRDLCELLGGPEEAGLVFTTRFLRPDPQDPESWTNKVRNSVFTHMPFEGVVVKSDDGKNSFKLKTQAWYDALQEHCKGDQAMFDRLM